MLLADSADSAARALAAYVRHGVERDATMIVIVRLETWNRAAVGLVRDGVPVSDLVAAGRLLVRDSSAMLASLMRGGLPDRARFEDVIAPLVRECASLGRPVHAYGDMVDLLAAAGRFEAAERLEDLWNDLAASVPFTLLCGYSSGGFVGTPEGPDALARLRRRHSHLECDPEDLAASELARA
jgi:hypothetical protein